MEQRLEVVWHGNKKKFKATPKLIRMNNAGRARRVTYSESYKFWFVSADWGSKRDDVGYTAVMKIDRFKAYSPVYFILIASRGHREDFVTDWFRWAQKAIYLSEDEVTSLEEEILRQARIGGEMLYETTEQQEERASDTYLRYLFHHHSIYATDFEVGDQITIYF